MFPLGPKTKRIYWRDFEKILRGIPELSGIERAYVQGVFQDALADGLTIDELVVKIDQLKHNFRDPLDASEVEILRVRLTKALQREIKKQEVKKREIQ